jgi:hypothetical protein
MRSLHLALPKTMACDACEELLDRERQPVPTQAIRATLAREMDVFYGIL